MKKSTMKIGIFTRVSKEEQKLNGISLNDQRDRGIEFCRLNGYDYEVYTDAGVSGTLGLDERPELSRLLDDIINKEINGVYATDFDRISRNTELSFLIRSTLLEEGIKLFDVNGEVNLNDETQSLLVGIKILLADFEIKKLKTRVKRALERNVIDGKVGGGALIPYGYTKDENKNLIVQETESEVIKTIFKLSINGLGTMKIAEYLNNNNIPTKRNITGVPMGVRGESKKPESFIWRDAVVFNILTNPLYKGLRRYKGKLYECPSIIPAEDWDLVQDLLKKKNNTKDTTNKYFYLLKGVLYCGKCGRRMYGRKRKDLSDNQYICSSQRFQGEFCGNRGINIDKSELLVWDSLMNLPNDLEGKYSIVENVDHNLNLDKSRFENELEKIETKRKKLIGLLLDESIGEDMVKPELVKLNESKSFFEEKLNNVNFQMGNKTLMNDTIEIIKNQIEEIKNKNLTKEEKRNIIHSYIKSVTATWNEDLKRHRLVISYGVTNSTFAFIENTIDINFVKRGFRYDEKSIEVEINAVTRNIDYENDKFIGNQFVEVKKNSRGN